MSSLNLDPLSGLLSVELVTPVTWPPGTAGVPVGSFERHLAQARQTVGQAAEADRPPPADPLPQRRDREVGQETPPVADSNADTSQPFSPARTEEDRSPATETPTDAEPQAGVSETPSEADRQTEISDGDAASDEEDENEHEEFTNDSAQLVNVLNIDPSGNPDHQEGIDGDAAVAAENATVPPEKPVAHEHQRRTLKPAQPKDQPAPADEPLPAELEETEPPEAKPAPSKDPIAVPEATGKKGTQMQEEDGTHRQVARQSEKSTEAENGPNGAASEASGPSDPQPSDAPPQAQGSPADSRRRDGRQAAGGPAGDRASGNPLAEPARAAQPAPTQQAPGLGSPTENKGEAGDTTAPGSTPTGNGEGPMAAPTQVWANEGTRQAPTTRGQGAAGSDQVDRVRFVQRVARAFEALGDRGGSVRLRLHPPELGSLRLEVTLRNGTMTARLEVETNTARSMLLDNLPALRDRLAQQDIKVGRFDVDLADRSAGGSPERPGDHPQSREHLGQGAPHTGSEQEIEAERPAQPRAVTLPGHGSQLDVVI